MSSDLFILDNSFFSDPFPTLIDPHPYDILQEIQENQGISIQENNNNNNNIPIDETSSFDQTETSFLSSSSSSPPRAELENLSLSQLVKTEYSVHKTEQCQLSFDGFSSFGNCFSPQSFDGAYETPFKFMQRSYSSNSFENNQNFLFRPQFDSVLESQDLMQNQTLISLESGFSAGGQMRRVFSTGDLQTINTEEANFKVGRYSAEERKEKIDRYRAKRTQRNFNKTIKYACRKTLADNRPRVRGRFARNDEAGEILKASMFHRYEDEDDHLWIDGFHKVVDGIAQKGTYFSIFGSSQYQNYSY